jgi:hypothetical protein
VKDKKSALIPYGFHIGFYMVKDTMQAKQEGLSQLEYQFPIGRFHKNDPKGLVPQNAGHVSSCCPYAHDSFEDEIFTKGTQYSEEVLHRRDNPSMMKFKVMTMDEQVDMIEHTPQEVIRVREETRAAEAWKRGTLLLEEVKGAM